MHGQARHDVRFIEAQESISTTNRQRSIWADRLKDEALVRMLWRATAARTSLQPSEMHHG